MFKPQNSFLYCLDCTWLGLAPFSAWFGVHLLLGLASVSRLGLASSPNLNNSIFCSVSLLSRPGMASFPAWLGVPLPFCVVSISCLVWRPRQTLLFKHLLGFVSLPLVSAFLLLGLASSPNLIKSIFCSVMYSPTCLGVPLPACCGILPSLARRSSPVLCGVHLLLGLVSSPNLISQTFARFRIPPACCGIHLPLGLASSPNLNKSIFCSVSYPSRLLWHPSLHGLVFLSRLGLASSPNLNNSIFCSVMYSPTCLGVPLPARFGVHFLLGLASSPNLINQTFARFRISPTWCGILPSLSRRSSPGLVWRPRQTLLIKLLLGFVSLPLGVASFLACLGVPLPAWIGVHLLLGLASSPNHPQCLHNHQPGYCFMRTYFTSRSM